GSAPDDLPYGSGNLSSPATDIFIDRTDGGPYYLHILGTLVNSDTVNYTLALELIAPPACAVEDDLGDVSSNQRNETPADALVLAGAPWPSVVGDPKGAYPNQSGQTLS